MGASSWSTEDDTYLRLNAPYMTAAQIAHAMNRGEKGVRRYAERRGIQFRPGVRGRSSVPPPPARDGAWGPGTFNFRALPMAPAQQAQATNDAELVARFLAERGVTQCPTMYAWGAAPPQYIGKSGFAA